MLNLTTCYKGRLKLILSTLFNYMRCREAVKKCQYLMTYLMGMRLSWSFKVPTGVVSSMNLFFSALYRLSKDNDIWKYDVWSAYWCARSDIMRTNCRSLLRAAWGFHDSLFLEFISSNMTKEWVDPFKLAAKPLCPHRWWKSSLITSDRW